MVRAFRALRPQTPLWRVTSAVTVAAFVVTAISWLSIFVDISLGGCMALGFFVVGGMMVFGLMAWLGLATFAAVGSFLSYRGNPLGPYLVLAPNLLLIVDFGTFGLATGGEMVWARVLVAFSLLPVLAALLATFQLVLRGVSGHLAGAFAGLLVIGLMLPMLGHGWLQDLSNASEAPISASAFTNSRTTC